MTDQELLERVRGCRPADLSDAMDAIGLVNVGSMSSRMRPVNPGLRMAGFAYTVKLLPAQSDVRVCATVEEYMNELGRWCEDSYTFTQGLSEGQGRDAVVVIDMDGYPGGIWGSAIALDAVKWGVSGVVVDGGCRDSYECGLEGVKVWCTARTFNHVYGRVRNGGVNVPIRCDGVAVHPGDIVSGDDDGVVVIPRDRAERVLEFAEAIHEADQQVRTRQYRELGLPPDDTLGRFGRR